MKELFDASNIIEWGGLIIVILLVFAETGLLLGLIIPGGETLIFTAGLFVSTGVLPVNVFLLLILLVTAAISGDASGYFIGYKTGDKLYQKKDTWFFKKKYLHKAADYFKKHPKKAILLGKFLPIIRPFIPLTSGITTMKKSRFFMYSLIAVAAYISLFLFAGYFLGNQFPGIKNYIGWILPLSILVLVVPVVLQIRKNG